MTNDTDIVERLRKLQENADWEAAHIGADLIEKLRGALRWYDHHVSNCRKMHYEGELARNALSQDGGDRARRALGVTND